MNKDYEDMWSEILILIQKGKEGEAKMIYDEVSEDAWKYNDLKN